MINKSRLGAIVKLSLPIIGSMISVNLLSLIDTFMVSYLGPESLAAAGMAGFASQFVLALVAGMAAAVQAMTARRAGEDRQAELAHPLNGGLLLSVSFGVPLAIAGYLLAPKVFPGLVTDETVIGLGTPYMQILLLSAPFVAMGNAFTGYWNGIGKPKYQMYTMLTTHAINLVLNYVLIFGKLGLPALGVKGAALGSLLSVIISTSIFFALGLKHARDKGFLGGKPNKETMNSMFKLAIPSCFQRALFWLGYTIFFTIVARVGATEMAIANVLVQITLFTVLPGMGMGLASATLVGQSLGRKDVEEANQWAWDVSKVAIIMGLILAFPIMTFPELVLAAFNLDAPEVLAVGVGPMRLVGFTTWVFSFNFIFMNSLLGAGAAKRVMITSISCQWGFMIPSAYVVGVVMDKGLFAIWVTQAIYGLIVGTAYVTQWKMGVWKNIKV